MRQLFRKVYDFLIGFFGRKGKTPSSESPVISTTPSGGVVQQPTGLALPPPITGEPELGLASLEPPQYRKKDFLFSYQERKFYELLLSELGTEYQVFAKVRMADVLMLANEPENRKYHSNQIQCKHLDFVLCDKKYVKPLVALELDDSSHSKFSRQESDDVKRQICEMAGFPLVRVQVQQNYPKGQIGEMIHAAMKLRNSPSP